MKEEREFILVSILMSEIKLSNIRIEQYNNIKDKLTVALSNLEISFDKSLNDKLVQSGLFNHLPKNERNDLSQTIKKICNDVDAAYLNGPLFKEPPLREPTQQNEMQTYSKQRHSQHEHELMKHNEKKNRIIEVLKQNQKITEYKPLDRPTIRHDKLAEQAIQMHQAFVKEKQELEAMIKTYDEKIEAQEMKKKQCLEKVNQLVGPEKKAKYIKTIEDTYNHVELKFVWEKERLETKKKEKETSDTAIKMLHPEIFGEQKVENSAIAKATAERLAARPPAEQDPSQRKWKSHASQKYHSSRDLSKGNMAPSSTVTSQKKPKGKT